MNFMTLHNVGNNHPNWRSHVSEGLKPPMSTHTHVCVCVWAVAAIYPVDWWLVQVCKSTCLVDDSCVYIFFEVKLACGFWDWWVVLNIFLIFKPVTEGGWHSGVLGELGRNPWDPRVRGVYRVVVDPPSSTHSLVHDHKAGTEWTTHKSWWVWGTNQVP